MKKQLRKTQTKEEAEAKRTAADLKKKKRDIENKYRYLRRVDDSMFQYSFLKAQAEEICDILNTLRLGPFKGLYQKYRDMVTDELFMHDYYLKLNKYKEISPDNVRLSELLPIKIIIED